MSDDEDDMFADDASDNTNDLIAASKDNKKSSKKSAVAAKDDDDDDDDGGLFDSDSDEEKEEEKKSLSKKKKLSKKPAASSSSKSSKKPAATATASKPKSKKERLEALANKRRGGVGDDDAGDTEGKRSGADGASSSAASKAKNQSKTADGYDSGDSYNSGDFQRTAEDDDFLDTTGEDPEAIAELYREENFGDDERPMGWEERKKKKKRLRAGAVGASHDSDDMDGAGDGKGEGGEPDNPIMAAVYRMKKKKMEKRSQTDKEEEAKAFLGKMDICAENDDQLLQQKKPALNKLKMLPEVVDMLTRRDMQRTLLELDVLSYCKRWIQPLPNGKLSNVTVRQRLLEAIANMNDNVTANDLKRSEIGKVVMVLFKHRDETPAMKRQLKSLIEQWSRPIFQKSNNMRDLVRVQASRGETGLTAVARQQQRLAASESPAKAAGTTSGDTSTANLDSIIATGKAAAAAGASGSTIGNRVRVPYSRGFAFSVRPDGRAPAPVNMDKKRGAADGANTAEGTRGKLKKRMLEKSRSVAKNQRSANVSVEGRAVK